MNVHLSLRLRRRRQTFLAGPLLTVLAAGLVGLPCVAPASATDPAPPPVTSPAPAGQDLQVEVIKKGLGKEVSIRKGNKEWFMMIEVTSDNTVIVRQEKENETYLVDESETHDRAMTTSEVDAAIDAFIISVKTQVKRK
ncbi:MAG: hypothetical protein HY581_08085 [Nitrospirae bacterium]|nr:hypothetical protein [Nitrospirota bacterium]